MEAPDALEAPDSLGPPDALEASIARRLTGGMTRLLDTFVLVFFTTDAFTHISFTSSEARPHFSSAAFFRELRRPPFLRAHGSSW